MTKPYSVIQADERAALQSLTRSILAAKEQERRDREIIENHPANRCFGCFIVILPGSELCASCVDEAERNQPAYDAYYGHDRRVSE